MYAPRKKVLWFAITTRIVILTLQVIFNVLIPDHQADAFKRPLDSAEKISLCDQIINFLFNGLTRWDGEYFLHIARYGYTYENTLAFYPLYPTMIHIIAVILTTVFPLFNMQSTMIVAAILINFVCFVKSAIIFYDLTESVFQNTITAYKAAILYCINPASIFFSALYSESMFAYLTFYIMLGSIKCMSNIYFPLALSTLVRSNGIINIGFPIYFRLKNLCNSERIETYGRKHNVLSILWHILKLMKLNNYFIILSIIIKSLFPFVLLQLYNYMKFCISTFDKSLLPVHILQYAVENNLILAGKTNSIWCNASVPLAYSYVQKTYWNVGFLRYYQFKQIPNFVLALPILYITLQCIKEFASEYRDELYLLGFFDSKAKSENIKVKKYPSSMFFFVIHGLFLTMFCLFFVHIQISTRLLASATPLIYWYCALTMSHKCTNHIDLQYESDENMCSKWKVFFLYQKRYTLQDKFILFYFIGYTIVGCFMFSNFLPWT
ncbi:PREDICTED: GPI mannosyltransferase 2 [Trachymyrmex cornetzi]|uniref:GPI mannosyltransferase 2 n=1 Tax=Trachymyrmex cornetzi TaxID=471704 RepID=A0A195EE16_9HYME|nr:PREDICTED: GPI mannosyltransferase 2 [Trachymyrmex cornetzi]KYN23089.1 GPI mannosyltransferase 2 [Trachymyrmex cornetzi]